MEQELKFAEVLANWPLESESFANLSKRFPGLLPEVPFGSVLYLTHRLSEAEQQLDHLKRVQERLREAWTAPDEWTRKHQLAALRVDEGETARINRNRERHLKTSTLTLTTGDVRTETLPDSRRVRVRPVIDVTRHREWTEEDSLLWHTVPQTGFQRVLDVLDAWQHRLKICGNSDCRGNRYFVGKRTSQRYCSTECAEVFQREAKRRWWELHGDQWRSERQQEADKPRRRSDKK